MNLLLLFLLSLASNVAVDSSFIVMYRTEIYKAADAAPPPKLAIPEEFREAIGKDSVDVSNLIPWPFIIFKEFRVNSKGDYSLREWAENPAVQLSTNDILYYKEGRFFTSEDTTARQGLNIIFTRADGNKKILGYQCQLFNATNKDNGQRFEVWATEELPQSITGKFLWPQFGHAVLEIRELEGKWKMTATSVMVDTTGGHI